MPFINQCVWLLCDLNFCLLSSGGGEKASFNLTSIFYSVHQISHNLKHSFKITDDSELPQHKKGREKNVTCRPQYILLCAEKKKGREN